MHVETEIPGRRAMSALDGRKKEDLGVSGMICGNTTRSWQSVEDL